jgi:SAM-dependent methyltransferase
MNGTSFKVPEELKSIYRKRFDAKAEYRNRLWKVLVGDFFQPLVPGDATVLDLGAGYGEFINHIRCGARFAMDLNPETANRIAPGITFLFQDCSLPWAVPDGSLDVVFTSNFFEHLPDKRSLRDTILQARRALRPGGKLIALGPNIRYVPGEYWDFWDHFLCLTDRSLGEALENNGFVVVKSVARFLPYSSVGRRDYPSWVVRSYLACPFVWRFFGRQFLIVAERSP